MEKKKILTWSIPVLGVGLLIAAGTFHGPGTPADVPPRKQGPTKSSAPVSAALVPAQASPPPKPSPEWEVARASERVRVKATFQNFRTALATGNVPLQERLLPILHRDRDAVLRIAEESLATTASGTDRSLTERALEALGK